MVRVRPALGNDPCALERNECSAVIGWSALLMAAALGWVARKDFFGKVISHNVQMTKRNQPGTDQERAGWTEGVAGTKSLRWEVSPVSLPLVDNILLISHTYSGVRELDWFSYPQSFSPADQRPVELNGMVSNYPRGGPASGLCLSYDVQAAVWFPKLARINNKSKNNSSFIYDTVPNT